MIPRRRAKNEARYHELLRHVVKGGSSLSAPLDRSIVSFCMSDHEIDEFLALEPA